MEPDDLCPRPEFAPPPRTQPMVPGIHPAVVYRCESPGHADRLLGGEEEGHVYARDGHPNADWLAEKCRLLHRADRAAICGSGMAALTAAVLSHVGQGDAVVAADALYGRSAQLLSKELPRFGVACKTIDACDLDAVSKACASGAKLLIAETISNPLLRVADVRALAEIATSHGVRLLIDNTFAGPAVFRPLEFGADLVVESITKIMNGHSDVVLGLVCGRDEAWPDVEQTISTWGLSSSPFDCWLAQRGLGTLALRVDRANANALAAARMLETHPAASSVRYPGLESHPDHAVAKRQFGERFGTMVAFDLPGGTEVAAAFIAAAGRIAFAPSLGDLSTTLSHPESTSHRGLTPQQRASLGISGGTIRLSMGIESEAAVLEAVAEGLSVLNSRPENSQRGK
ncbi:MAG: aminotransferase class I/II-fold pyridoxal phosphate-dependent enzyme [Planctomycetales bacterium]